MKPLIQVKTTIPPVRKPVNPVSAGFLIPLVLVCFGLAPTVQAVGPDTEGAHSRLQQRGRYRGARQPHYWGLEHGHWFPGA